MMRATGFLLGAVLVSGVFLFALNAGMSSPSVVPPLAETVPAVDGVVSADVADNEPQPDAQSLNKSMADDVPASNNDNTEVSRYQVWSPFRSEWAAQGFAQRLTLATDVPVEVVNEEPGNYQVVFSYRDDGERQALVEHIETVTGLELE